jgi:hypothetical protein
MPERLNGLILPNVTPVVPAAFFLRAVVKQLEHISPFEPSPPNPLPKQVSLRPQTHSTCAIVPL